MKSRLTLAVVSAAVVAAGWSSSSVAAPGCHSPGGLTPKTCIDTTGSCTVGQYNTTPAGTGYTCLVRRP
jgi:hypothetical protein